FPPETCKLHELTLCPYSKATRLFLCCGLSLGTHIRTYVYKKCDLCHGGSLTSVLSQKEWSPWAYARCIKYIVPVERKVTQVEQTTQ
ncbi:hypothetical protein GBAR_LOCUS26208, partial [Geodia barretti]